VNFGIPTCGSFRWPTQKLYVPKTFVPMKRLNALDYFRGMAALAILLYHFCSWTFGQFDSSSLLGPFGIYGVSIFYLLSGLTFFTVYHSKFQFTFRWNLQFYVKRLLRIFPMLWIATFLHLLFVKGPIDLN
jgi:exopolysaccharide production protein ExoZ